MLLGQRTKHFTSFESLLVLEIDKSIDYILDFFNNCFHENRTQGLISRTFSPAESSLLECYRFIYVPTPYQFHVKLKQWMHTSRICKWASKIIQGWQRSKQYQASAKDGYPCHGLMIMLPTRYRSERGHHLNKTDQRNANTNIEVSICFWNWLA